MSTYEPVIGLEVHLALNTNSKIFCSSDSETKDATPNVNVDAISLGLPGCLPVLNKEVVEKGIMLSMAVNCEVPSVTQFHRKHYFYPDLPKNYQISQYDRPIGEHGFIQLNAERRIGITRCHMEEDAGKSQHPAYAPHSLVDLNRTGQPLIEMVTEPEISSPEEAREFLTKVRAIAQALGVSEANPEEGKMRADVNVSVRLPGAPFGTKVEIKNLNSFKAVQNALEFEIKRQSRVLEDGGEIRQETRGWDDGGQKTYVMRVKEGEADYRYMSDPDLPPIHIDEAWLELVRNNTPELPDAKFQRYLDLGLRDYDANIIAFDIDLATFYDETLNNYDAVDSKAAQNIANWLNSDVVGWLKNEADNLNLSNSQLSPENLAELVKLVDSGEISGRTGKDILPDVMQGNSPKKIVDEKGLGQITDSSAIEAIVDTVIAENQNIVEQIKENPKALNSLLGRVMKASQGKAKPDVVRNILQEKLGLS